MPGNLTQSDLGFSIDMRDFVNEQSLNRIIDYLESIKEITNKIDTGVLEKQAFLITMDVMSNVAMEYLLKQAKQALYDNHEFNYDGFPAHFLASIQETAKVLLEMASEIPATPVKIIIDLSKLGDASDYVNVVRQAYKAKMPETVSGGLDWRSIKWRELYLAAREGVRVIHKKRKRKGRKGLGAFILKGRHGEMFGGFKPEDWNEAEVTSEVDVTEKYASAYIQTMADRLSLMPIGFAPYWEIIEYGNAGVGDVGYGGTPYPSVAPTNFINKTQLAIEEAFDSLFNRNFSRIKEEFEDSLGVTGGLQELAEQLGGKVSTWVEELAPPEAIENAKVGQILGKLTETENLIKTQSGKLGRQFDLKAWQKRQRGE
jgi:hypothetical protein